MNIITKSYESLLPFLVVEAISAQGTAYSNLSVRMIDEGWAWLVSGRKLLIWKFKESKETTIPKSRRNVSPCFELQLPQSDLSHRADLIHVFFMPQNPNTSVRAATVPATLVISPEGTIRFWSNIANERFTESSVSDLQGQEFCTLVPLSNLEYLVGTTTGSVFIITVDINSHDLKNIIFSSPLTAPGGLLSGFSRRVTNLFFGPINSDTVGTDMRRPLIAVPKYSQSTIDKTGSTDRPFFVLSSTFKIRQWSRTNEGIKSTNQLIREWDIQRNVFAELVSNLNCTHLDNLNFWPIDMITNKSKELLILIVTLDTANDNKINYATCVFNPYQAGESIDRLTILRSHTWNYSNESEDQLLALRFLERRVSSSLLFMYDKKFLFLIKIDQDILDAIDYGNQDDGVLGAGIVDGHPILFTQRDGLMYVVPVASNKSRLNETSIQLEPPQTNPTTTDTSRQDSLLSTTSAKVKPMIVEVEEDEENEAEDQTRRQRTMNEKNESSMNLSVDQSSRSQSRKPAPKRKDDLSDILKESKEYEWIQQLDNKQFGLASETLAKLAEESEALKDRKTTLLALSKLAKLAE